MPTLLDPNSLRRFSISPFSQDGRLTPGTSVRGISPYPQPPPRHGGFKGFVISAWDKNAGPILVVLAQLFGALMNLSARFLELEYGMHPMQILCARMTSTIVCCFAYMYWKQVPTAPWGPREVRWLLVLRGMSGFMGLYGIWYSIMYLPLAEATVISFLAPNLAGYLCRIFLNEPFTRKEQIGSFLALLGVILIMRPVSLFSDAASSSGAVATTIAEAAANATITGQPDLDHVPTAAERLRGIGMGLLGVVGSAVTIVILRTIGKRAHPLISVNYFSTFCTLVTVLTLSIAPSLHYNQPALQFMLPTSVLQTFLLLVVGLCGFATQLSLTAGLAREKSNRATAMIYTHVLFAAGFDRFFFGNIMGWVSVAGCGLIVGSALWVAVSKKEQPVRGGVEDVEARIGMRDRDGASDGEEESAPMLGALVEDVDDRGEDDDEDGDDMVVVERVRT